MLRRTPPFEDSEAVFNFANKGRARSGGLAPLVYSLCCLLRGQGNHNLSVADVDGDELFDYVVNPAPLQCQGAATALCANDGCDIRLY